MLELRNDVVALFSRLHPLHKTLQALAPQPEMVDALWEHPGKEQGIVTNMFPHLLFAIKRWSRPIDRIRFEHHFAQVGQRAIGLIVNLEQLIRLAKLSEQVRHIRDYFRIPDPDLLGIMPSHQFLKKLP